MASPEAAAPLPRAGLVAVFDLEWTSWEGAQARGWSGPGEEREIVEIGAVLLDAGAGLRETACFETLVRPRINPVLSDYFVRLTGIDQAMVESAGVPFRAALADFAAFLHGARAALSFGQDPAVLRRNCALHGLDVPFPDALFRNVRGPLAAFAGCAPDGFSSSDLPALLGFAAPAGAAHRALADAQCIAEALRRWRAATG